MYLLMKIYNKNNNFLIKIILLIINFSKLDNKVLKLLKYTEINIIV